MDSELRADKVSFKDGTEARSAGFVQIVKGSNGPDFATNVVYPTFLDTGMDVFITPQKASNTILIVPHIHWHDALATVSSFISGALFKIYRDDVAPNRITGHILYDPFSGAGAGLYDDTSNMELFDTAGQVTSIKYSLYMSTINNGESVKIDQLASSTATIAGADVFENYLTAYEIGT